MPENSPNPCPCITAASAFSVASGAYNIKASGKPDLMLLMSESSAVMAAVMTRSTTCGANIHINREHLKSPKARAIVCNAGNANAATGTQGHTDAQQMAKAVASALNIEPQEVFVLSTGVIGQHLPMNKINHGIQDLSQKLNNGADADLAAAKAILTTDLIEKTTVQSLKLAGKTVQIGGMAKGSGMISPNMATMLVCITTDVAITKELLQKALDQAVNADGSFNRITVDTDTSTSDAVLVMANGAAGNPIIETEDEPFLQFTDALTQVCQTLAYKVIADGEGLEHVIDVTVAGAVDEVSAERFARAIADSPLVKTAIHGKDPNWGRIVMALGKTAQPVNLDEMSIKINDHSVFGEGAPTTFDAKVVSKSMEAFDQKLWIDLNMGKAHARVLGCDLSREYIAINADYTT